MRQIPPIGEPLILRTKGSLPMYLSIAGVRLASPILFSPSTIYLGIIVMLRTISWSSLTNAFPGKLGRGSKLPRYERDSMADMDLVRRQH